MLAPLGAALPFSTEVRSKTCRDVRRPPPSPSAMLFVMTHACMSSQPVEWMAPPCLRAWFVLKVQAYMSIQPSLKTAPPIPCSSSCCAQWIRDARCEQSRLLLALAYAVDHGVR